ncbi:MAG: hypothetical protein K8R13_04575 [Methanococcoides sp.]|nr:hypothetical protein [Methanococcoides sp.]
MKDFESLNSKGFPESLDLEIHCESPIVRVEESKRSQKYEGNKVSYCGLPVVPDRQLDANINPNREALVRYIEKKWVNYTVLHYHFLDNPEAWQGDESQKQVVRESFQEWKDLGIGLEFKEVTNPSDAEIRIAFESGGSWSYVGRDAIDLVPNPNEQTMNFGWDLTTPYGRDTALHEIGHALGFPHEHQNPNAGIDWDEEAVHSYFSGSPNNWNRNKIIYNIIRKISPSAVEGSQWDKDSIMHYRFPAGLIITPEIYQNEPLVPLAGLSEIDIKEVKKFYPEETKQQIPELKPYLSQLIQIDPGEQLDFVIQPSLSRKYTMQTFGNLDAVMVLFEDVDGEPIYLSGDDDSGTNYNAQIKMRLVHGRTYYLRLRLYHAQATGQGAVMLW